MSELRFSSANTKLKKLYEVDQLSKWLVGNKKICSFDMLSGWTCPAADECLSKVIIDNGKKKIKDGKNVKFRCFSASQEALFPNVYNLRKGNFDTILDIIKKDGSIEERKGGSIEERIQEVMPKNAGIVRIHVAGDFFNRRYFEAWRNIAKNNPNILFYAYTKQVKLAMEYDMIENFVLTMSYGGIYDHLIDTHNLRTAKVFNSESEAIENGFCDIDYDDSHAAIPENRNNSFALIIHGTQPKKNKSLNVLENAE